MDKFYTVPSVSKKCIDTVEMHYPWSQWDLVIEPSAGDGSFSLQIPSENIVAIDIEPEHTTITRADFLSYHPPPSDTNVNILTIGNPPFGRVSSMAIKFFNHASKWSSVIAFIVPRTFRRISVQNKLHPMFHLVHDEDVPLSPCSFQPVMNAKCAFQIWEKRNEPRNKIELPSTHCDWDYKPFGANDENGQPTPPSDADFAIRAYGGQCGEIRTTHLQVLRPKSWHWIKANIDVETLIQRFKSLDYACSLNTARQNSIGKKELVQLYSNAYNCL